MLPGNPVTLMSANLGSSGDQEDEDNLFLNMQQGERDCLDFVTDQDDQGNFVHYLVLFGALLSVSGQDRYMLASLVDVSHLVDAILEDEIGEDAAEEDIWLSLASDTASKKVSDAKRVSLDDAIQEAEDLWLASTHSEQSRKKLPQPPRPTDTALRNFMDDMQKLYKDYFCLSRSQVDSSY